MHRRRQLAAIARGDPDGWDRSPASWHARGPAVPYLPGGPECGLPDCDRPEQAGGLCSMHRQRRDRAARNGHPDTWDRSPRPVTVR
jgi:hypothetical protein